ncbi:hypothetical protein Ddye_006687 [Dipteronia dyeriana]|uniref:Protein FAR1-RELATED SEQUENCE n=1 Tax=Dipteronia dyeriana TaxID=168575 RepID=A0AAD9XIP1_9ROSI|nr:hypothetical protein Ddye_006687 [Dipteronia dyeriana]
MKTSDSFVWLLEQFKKNMPDGPPKMIITDQDPAMTKAISQALPDTFHSKEEFDSTWMTIIGKIVRQRHEELIVDHADINEKPVLKMPNLIEKQMAETYTHASKTLEDILNNAILDIKSTLSSGGSGGVFQRNNAVPHVYNEPFAVKARGCGKRLKRGKEKAKNKVNDRD